MGKIKKFMSSPVTWRQVTILSLISILLTGAAYVYLSADIIRDWLRDSMKTPKKKKR